MRIGGLTLKIYLYSIVAVLATIGMFVATAFALRSEHRQNMIMASGHIVSSFWQHHDDPKVAATIHATRSSHELVTLYDQAGRLVASTAVPPLPMLSTQQLAELEDNGFVELGYASMAHEVWDDGRLVAIGIVKFRISWLWSVARPLFILPLALLVVAVILARRLARPLQHMANVAKRFGAGDLGARIGTHRKDEIGELGRAFDAMADRIAALIAAQQELMANISHELLTPLARIRVAVDLVTDKESGRVEDLVPDIAQDLTEIERLLDDVMTVAKLDLSRTQAPTTVVPLRREDLSIPTLFEEAVARFRAQHPARRLLVELDPGLPRISGDAVLLRRVVDNLLENARKFSEGETPIRLSARATDAAVTIAVSDEGIGIDEADLEHVFTPFFRTDKSRSRSSGGVGLGLALARRVVEAHGGTIAVDSTAGRGTTVAMALPA